MDVVVLKSLKNILKFSQAQKFADYTLDSGAVIRVEGDLVVGTAVSVVAADGSTSPAPDAVHVIEGVAKVKTEGGIITEIMPIEEEMGSEKPEQEKPEEMSSDAPAEEAPAAFDAEEMMAMMMAKMAELEAKVAAIEAKMMEAESKMSSLFSANFSLIEVVDELSKKPTAEPSKPNYFNAFKAVKTDEEKLNRLKEISKGFTN